MRHTPSHRRDPTRVLRDKLLSGRDPLSATRLGQNRASAVSTTPRFLGQITNGGSMPSGQGRIYYVHPMQVDGDETEGGAATIQVDTMRSIPVLVLGGRPLVVGDAVVVQSVGGRWVADSGVMLPNCNPLVPACTGNRYSANGTVIDSINGIQPITYDYAAVAWYSAWLPYTSPYVLQSGTGFDPCTVGSGSSYYFHKLTINANTGLPVATLVLPGQSCHNASGGAIIPAFFKYQNTSTYATYPAQLGSPASWSSSGFPITATALPSSCDPLVFAPTWPTSGTAGPYLPMSGASYSVPKIAMPNYGYSCGAPCPLPRKDLNVSWTSTGGNGSGTLVYDTAAKTWTMPCSGNLAIQLTMVGNQSIGFSVRLYSSSNCSGTPSLFSYGSNINLTAYTCEPLYLEFKPSSSTQALYLAGYRLFAVTQ